MATFTYRDASGAQWPIVLPRVVYIELSDTEVSDESDGEDSVWYADVLSHEFFCFDGAGAPNALRVATTNAEYIAHTNGRLWMMAAGQLRELAPDTILEISSDMRSVRLADTNKMDIADI